MLGGLRFGEILVILLIVLVLFGKDRLPNVGSSLGQAIRNFKRGFSGEDEPVVPPAEPAQLSSTAHAAPTVEQPKVATKQG
jgi:sec-independent protein translocase protein TatA